MAEKYYTPGVCNINPTEAAYRKKAFYLGLTIGLPLLLMLVVLQAPPVYGLLMFMPIWIGAIGYLQSKNKFCVGYARARLYNSGPEEAETAQIVEKSKRKLDKVRARRLNNQAFAIGLVGALLSVVILFLP